MKKAHTRKNRQIYGFRSIRSIRLFYLTILFALCLSVLFFCVCCFFTFLTDEYLRCECGEFRIVAVCKLPTDILFQSHICLDQFTTIYSNIHVNLVISYVLNSHSLRLCVCERAKRPLSHTILLSALE